MKYLKIFTDFLDVVEPLGDSAAGRLFKAMLRYAMDGTVPVLRGKEGVAWTVARQHMDREAEVYEKKVKHLKRGNVPVTEKKGSVSEQDKDKEKDNDKDKDKDIYILSLCERGRLAARERNIYAPLLGDMDVSLCGKTPTPILRRGWEWCIMCYSMGRKVPPRI